MGNVKSVLSSPDQTRVTIPVDYEVPSFPSLYAPNLDNRGAHYLYFAEDMWRFTVLWTLIFIGLIHLVGGTIACLVFFHKHPLLAASAPFIATAYGLIIAFISSAMVGVALAAVYNAAHFNMATWVPFLWGLVQALVLVLGMTLCLFLILPPHVFIYYNMRPNGQAFHAP
ncbi:hypothetical protein BDY24DRAFT_440749 [Mrakia frigida]|uniref:uncharacterized protein n=1 Tax=Mrakia frigida TaxID=29902 RepID=UPI003FCC0D35